MQLFQSSLELLMWTEYRLTYGNCFQVGYSNPLAHASSQPLCLFKVTVLPAVLRVNTATHGDRGEPP